METIDLHFENLLYLSRSVLNNTCSRIQKIFYEKEICIYEYFHKDKTSKGLEIVINNNAILTCLFENDNCNMSILYFKDLANLERYIHYCNKNFTYNKKQSLWIMPDSHLSLFFPDGYEKQFAFVQTLIKAS